MITAMNILAAMPNIDVERFITIRVFVFAISRQGASILITAGVDVGAQTVKVALLIDEQLLSTCVLRAGMDRVQTAREAFDQALGSSGIDAGEVSRVLATGVGRKEINWAHDTVTEIASAARGANYLLPSVRTIVDVGAEESRGIRVDGKGKVEAFAKNDKCAAGVGSFVESMARALEVSVEQMGRLSLESDKLVPMNVTCVVFAESEVVSLIHAGTPKVDITRAIHEAIATRIISMVRRIGIERDVVVIGGVAKNPGLIERLTGHLGAAPLSLPEPTVVSAIGAALIAAENSDGGN